MTATAERIKQDFGTLSLEEKEELLTEFYQQVRAEQEADWPMSPREEASLRASLREAEDDFKAGRGIPHEEMVRRFAPWRKPTP